MVSSLSINELYASIDRIFAMIMAIWIAIVLKMGSNKTAVKTEQKPKTLKEIQEDYANKYKSAFLSMFGSDTDHSKWNANVDPAFFDPSALSEILRDPDNEIEKKWKRSILIEHTPRGNVVMFYDAYKQAFAYYCDQAVMPYDIMNAAAMKYVLTFRCRDFFVDSAVLPLAKTELPLAKTELPLAKTELPLAKTELPLAKTELPSAKKPDQQPFAKFKTYNNSTKKNAISKEDDKIINRFLHLGQVRNWNIAPKTPKPNPLNGFKTDMIPSNIKLSYSDYKKLRTNAL